MNEPATPSEATNNIMAIRELSNKEEFFKAFNLMCEILDKYPETQHVGLFRTVLKGFNDQLAQKDQLGDIYENILKAMSFFPNDKTIHNIMGKWLSHYGHGFEACTYFQNALRLDPGYVTAEKNLNSVKSLMMNRWHFQMLNDSVRNSAYRRALKECVKEDDHVLDVGTGCGLLALYARENKPQSITAIEGCKYMSQIAATVLKANHADNVIIIPKHSDDVSRNEIGFPKTVIVTEIFDAGLLGEQALQTLSHCINTFADETKPIKVIPARAEIFVIGIDSPIMASRYRLNKSILRQLKISDLNVVKDASEPYDCDDVWKYKDLKYVTKAEKLLDVNFTSVNDMQKILCEDKVYNVNFTATEDATISLFVCWFKLHLTDSISITTDPRDEDRASAWQQAIFHNFVSLKVTKNKVFQMKFSAFEGKLQLIDDDVTETFQISEQMIRFLNDSVYLELINQYLDTGVQVLKMSQYIDKQSIADACPFPWFGFHMLKHGLGRLYCFVAQEDESFLETVMEVNSISMSKIRFLDMMDHDGTMLRGIYYHVIGVDGQINKTAIRFLEKLKKKYLHNGGFLLPYNFKIVGKAIISDSLDKFNYLSDKNLGNFDVAKYLNKFQVSEIFDVNLSNFDYKIMTDDLDFAVLSPKLGSGYAETYALNSGQVNAVLCYYKVRMVQYGDWVSTNHPYSFTCGRAFISNPTIEFEAGNVVRVYFFSHSTDFKTILEPPD